MPAWKPRRQAFLEQCAWCADQQRRLREGARELLVDLLICERVSTKTAHLQNIRPLDAVDD